MQSSAAGWYQGSQTLGRNGAADAQKIIYSEYDNIIEPDIIAAS